MMVNSEFVAERMLNGYFKSVTALTPETVEQIIDDAFDIEYRIDCFGHCKSVLIVLSPGDPCGELCQSPYVEIDTKESELRLCLSSIAKTRNIPAPIVAMIFDYAARDFFSIKEYKISEKCVHKKLTKLNEKTGRNTSDCDILKVMQCRNCSFKQTAEERRVSEETAAQRLRSLTVEMIRYLEEKYGIFINERG